MQHTEHKAGNWGQNTASDKTLLLGQNTASATEDGVVQCAAYPDPQRVLLTRLTGTRAFCLRC